jgi:predicted metal-dependent hydrolase
VTVPPECLNTARCEGHAFAARSASARAQDTGTRVTTLPLHRPAVHLFLELDENTVEVLKKNIKNVHLRVYPPAGRVRISAPARMSLDTIRLFAISRLGWIREQQTRLREHARASRREYVDGERHDIWGRSVLLNVLEEDAAPSVQLCHATLVLRVRRGADEAAREGVVATWYRQQVEAALPPLIEEWERRLNVQVKGSSVRRMKTRWGSCNPGARTIRLNTELAKKPRECLEYVVVHEMVHLIERGHGPRFVALMDRFMPAWRVAREQLNRRPETREGWNY